MKKFILFVSLLFMITTFNYSKSVKAFDWWRLKVEDYNVKFELVFNTDSNGNIYMDILVRDIDQFTDISYLNFWVPEDLDILRNDGNQWPFSIWFYDTTNNLITYENPHLTQLDGEPDRPYGYYYFNIPDIETQFNATIDYTFLRIPTTLLSMPTADIFNYFKDNIIVTREIKGVYDYNLVWSANPIINNYNYIYTDVVLYSDNTLSSLFIPYTDFHIGAYGIYNSKVDYFDYNSNLLCSFDISDKAPFNTIININPVDNYCNEYADRIKKARIYIIEKPLISSITQEEYLTDMQERSKISLDHELYLVNVYNGNVLLTQNAYGYNELTGDYLPYFRLRATPQPIDDSLEFKYFAYVNGTEFKMNREIGIGYSDYYALQAPSDQFFINNTLNLYSVFKIPSDDIPTEVIKNVDNNLQDVVNIFGFDNQVGWLILYFIIVLLVDIALYVALKNNLLVLIFDLIITGFFTYLGVLSILIQIILYGLLVVISIRELRKE